jgi:SAM-dependent methyltransferase
MNKVADLFDAWAKNGRAEGMETGHGKTAGPLLGQLAIVPGSVFLDLGCGNGWASRFAASRGARAIGIDASLEMTARARQMAASASLDTTPGGAGPGAEFHVGDFAELRLDDGIVQTTWSMEALYYAPDPDAVLREAARVMAAGGTMHVIIDFYGENVASHSWPMDVGVPMQLRTSQEWVAAFEAAGFSNVAASRLLATDPEAEDWKRVEGSLYLRATR